VQGTKEGSIERKERKNDEDVFLQSHQVEISQLAGSSMRTSTFPYIVVGSGTSRHILPELPTPGFVGPAPLCLSLCPTNF